MCGKSRLYLSMYLCLKTRINTLPKRERTATVPTVGAGLVGYENATPTDLFALVLELCAG
jgi:hypothetical protein